MKLINIISDSFCSYFLLFFLTCVIGWINEVLFEHILGNGFINRGFLYGPYLPIYGFGALILISALKKIKVKQIYLGKILLTPLVVFICTVIITTSIEYISSYTLEIIFHRRWWDYSGYKGNVNGRICPMISILLGVGGMIFLYVLLPLFTKIINIIPKDVLKALTLVFGGLLLIDFCCQFRNR